MITQAIHVRRSMLNRTPLDASTERSGVWRASTGAHPARSFGERRKPQAAFTTSNMIAKESENYTKPSKHSIGELSRRKRRVKHIYMQTHHSTWRGVDNDVVGSMIRNAS